MQIYPQPSLNARLSQQLRYAGAYSQVKSLRENLANMRSRLFFLNNSNNSFLPPWTNNNWKEITLWQILQYKNPALAPNGNKWNQ